MKVLPDIASVPWIEVNTNRWGKELPWPVHVGNVDYLWNEEHDYRYLGKAVLEYAAQVLDESDLEGSLWCGYSGWRVVRLGTHGDREHTWAVATEGLMTHKPPNPLVYAFRHGLPNLPTVAMYEKSVFEKYDPDEEVLSAMYALKPGIGGLDVVTRALFTFRSDEYERMMESPPNGINAQG